MKIDKNKTILDACCGGRMFYFDKNNPSVLYQDIRDETMILCDGRTFSVKPDVIADFTHMPYDNETFKMVIFDPPHLLRNVGTSKFAAMYGSLNCKAKPKGYQQIKYGAIDMNWRETLRAGFAECFRVLQKGGVLIFKWSDIDIPVSKILELTPYKPLFGNRLASKIKRIGYVL